jgi:type I restriction enzyme, S subunit
VKWTLASVIEASGPHALFVDGDWVESKDQDPEGDVRLTQLADVGDGTWLNKSSRFMTAAKARDLRCTLLKPGDILIARMPDPLGRACLFPGDHMPCVTVVDVCIARPGNGLERRWLVHQLNAPSFRQQLARFINGTTRQRISRTNLGQVLVDVPPLPEQRRIADILDKADAIRRKRKEAIALTEDLLRSAFLEMFGDPVTNPKGWPVRPLGETTELFAGNSLPLGEPFGGQSNGVLLLKVGDMNLPGNEVNVESAREWASDASGGVVAPAGSVVFPKRGGAIATNKKRVLMRPAALDPNLMAVAPTGSLSLSYLQQWFEMFDLASLSSGSAVPQLNKKDLMPLRIAVPSEAAQAAFGAAAERVAGVRRRAERAVALTERLFSGLVQRAFRGELGVT